MKKYLTIIIFAALCSRGMAQTCDTLFNLQSNLDTMSLIVADTFSAADTVGIVPGYLAGNNVFGDLAKAEAFAVDSGDVLNFATIYFGDVTINPTDTNAVVTIYAWDNTGVSLANTGAPGLAFDSMPVTLGEIAQAVGANQGLLAYFIGNTIYTDTIYVGIVLPTIPGDTVALYTNTAPPGPDGNGWEENASGVWSSYNDDWGVTSGSLGNYIKLGVCNSLPYAPAAAFAFTNTPASTCTPNIVNFTDNTQASPAQNSWVWSFGDGSYSNIQNPSHAYTTGGTYYVTETVTNDTDSLVQVFIPAINAVSILPTPSVSPFVIPEIDTTYYNVDTVYVDTLEAPGSASITVTGGSGYYFATWSDGTYGNNLASTAPGTYTVTVLDQNGCSIIDTVIIPVTLTAISPIINAVQQIKVYPNPVSQLLTVTSGKDISGFDFKVFDMEGRIILSQRLEGLSNSINVSSLAEGTYIFKVTDKLNATVGESKFTVVK